jgi:hypothetical protein
MRSLASSRVAMHVLNDCANNMDSGSIARRPRYARRTPSFSLQWENFQRSGGAQGRAQLRLRERQRIFGETCRTIELLG